MSKNKGKFNTGWWNCFYTFAAELLSQNPNATDICKNVLKAAGITEREAAWQVEHTVNYNSQIDQIVREYWLECK